jgi:hypothetical protein
MAPAIATLTAATRKAAATEAETATTNTLFKK